MNIQESIKVSIITICYNSEQHLEQTILSVKNQSYSNIEYIIIDGGSTDNTINIIKKHELSISHYISESDNGISDAFNKGISLATGEIIGTINSDDWYEPDAVLKIVNSYQSIPCDVIHGNVQYWQDDQKNYLFSANHKLLSDEMTINHMSCFVSNKTYKKHGKFLLDFKYSMDYELMLRFYLNKCNFIYIDQTISNMRLDGVSDRYWYKAHIESCKAKIINGQSKFFAILYLCKQIIRCYVSKQLSKYGFERIKILYRRKFAKVSKKL